VRRAACPPSPRPSAPEGGERGILVSLLAVFLLLSASIAQAREPWEDKWDALVAAARAEGAVSVSGPPGLQQREAITSVWAESFPDIKLDYTAARGTQIVAKVVRERTAGVYNWDVILSSTDPTIFALMPIKALKPIRDALIVPELTQDKTWIDGFESGFVDAGKKFFYSPVGTAGILGYVNRDCLSRDLFSKTADMARPELKGKIVWFDPVTPSTGTQGLGLLAQVQGEAWLEDLFQHHDVTFSRDYRQMANWLVSCVKPVAIGMPDQVLEPMRQNGIGLEVEELDGPSYFGNRAPGGVGGNASMGWYENAPHPNAAKLFVNWYLMHAEQQRYAELVKVNSRRADVPPQDPAHVLKPGIDYFNTAEDNIRWVKALQAKIKTWGVLP